MPRRIRVGEVKTRFLDVLLLLFSITAIIGSFGFLVFIIVGFSEFHAVPFVEFLILLGLGLIGYRTWRKEINA